jgi:glucose-1-phosphate thymidylyltransferase
MKGIVLAGGTGSRLWPITRGVSKQLLPVYDKPMIHYPISTLMAAGIREILLITTPEDKDAFQRLLGTGEELGVNFTYKVQPSPDGLAQAFILGKEFIGSDKVSLILGDNLFHGSGLGSSLQKFNDISGGQIFAYRVSDPTAYGIVEFGKDGKALSIEEKPSNPKSHYAVPGLYFYDNDVVEIAEKIKPSARGELEITSVNNAYLDRQLLNVSVLDRGAAWLDTGTFNTLHEAGSYVKIMEERQGTKVGCIEEWAWRNRWIDDNQLIELAKPLTKSGYGDYLLSLVLEGR